MAGGPGNFRVTVTRRPKYIDEAKCTGCTTCVEYCPVEYPDKFNKDISQNKAIHIYFPQAIPLVAYVDESCLYLKENKCRICEAVCKNDAIDLKQQPETKDITVGAIILSAGLEPYDPSLKAEYHYGEFQNVVTSMDFERLLSSTGPYSGEIRRTSDKEHPKKYAWIQCVGSRQVTEGGHSYCSAVCCTYAQKQVILSKDHDADAECTIFHNDIRSYGKDFERFYERTKNLSGVRFVRSYTSIVREDPETKNVFVRYATNDGGVIEEEFDMVVLSVGLSPPANVKELAETFDIELTGHNFCKIDEKNPMLTNKPGIFISGAFQGPIDIPESVFSASGAGSQVGELLDYRRGKMSVEREYPDERDVTAEEPRIGVFVCHCGANISRVVSIPETVEYCKTLPNVLHSQEQLFSCATNSAKEITDVAKELGLNRIVVAACSPKTLEPLFRDTTREAGINQYYYEMPNIREHNSWVHAKEKEIATKKAHDLIRMSVARAALLEPLQEFELPVNKAALVIGGGLAGMTCALSIARQGHVVYLLEKEKTLGGMMKRIHNTLDGMDVQAHMNDLITEIYQNKLVHVYTGATITSATGYVGNFVTTINSTRGPVEIKHGAAVLANGAELTTPEEYLYGEDDRVTTHLEFDEMLHAGDPKATEAESVIMIQCVGCRNEDRDYCSRICCSESIKNALHLREINPTADIYILFRDVRTYGLNEDYYRKAADLNIRFVRYEEDAKPVVEPGESDEGKPVLKVSLPDLVLGKQLELDADLVVLAAAIKPSEETEALASLFKVVLSPDGYFKEAHVKLRPVEFATEGVYLCGLNHYPKFIQETINQAYGAAGRVMTLLSHDIVIASGSVCQIDEDKCMGCGACAAVCTYGALEVQETKKGRKVTINPVLCKGDGLCNAKCPTGAISLKHYKDEQINSIIDALANETPANVS